MEDKLKKKIKEELAFYVKEWIDRADRLMEKSGWATLELNAKIILQKGEVTQLTFNGEHIKIQEKSLQNTEGDK